MGLFGVHQCLGGLQMVLTCPARQTAGRESPQDWLVRLGIDIATICDMWSQKQPELMPFDHMNFFESEDPATLWLPTTPYLPSTFIGMLVVLTTL